MRNIEGGAEHSDVQTLIFDKSKFTRDQAESWAKSHGFQSNTSRETDNSIRVRQFPPGECDEFLGTKDMMEGVQALFCSKGASAIAGLKSAKYITYDGKFEAFEKDSKRYAKLFLIDDGILNKNEWGITKEALDRYLQTFVGKPLLGPPDAGHGPNNGMMPLPMLTDFEVKHKVGTIIQVGYDGRVGYAVAEVTSPQAWDSIKSGQWRWVSPLIIGKVFERTAGGGELYHEFEGRHLAFVDRPAYGSQAGVKGTCEAPEFGLCNFGASINGFLTELKELGKGKSAYMPTEEEFKAKCAEVDKLKIDLASAQKIMNDLKAAEDARRLAEINVKASKLVDLRIQAGLAKKEERDTLIASYAKIDGASLDAMVSDFELMVQKIAEAGRRDVASRSPTQVKFASQKGTGSELNAVDALAEMIYGEVS